jgi:hypothetical protein
MLIMSKYYPVEQRERAVKMVLDHLDEYRSVYAACQAIGPKVGVGAESLRRWEAQTSSSAGVQYNRIDFVNGTREDGCLMARRMKSKSFQQQQLDGIRLLHVEPFNRLVDEIATPSEWVPYVAPQYGGVEARLLALFRDPGPKTQRIGGSGMLCTENDDPSAERYSNLLANAGISVRDLMAWNIYPWYINRKPTLQEIKRGLGPLQQVIDLLPNLRIVMAHGGDAQYAWKLFSRQYPSTASRLQLIETYHTSPQALRTPDPLERAARESKLRSDFARAAEALHG